ncbi:hypothetical protein ACFYNO_33205 [Kitasatospora sp. NPDC006697]|uniref:hypothetical protein n=1 Tax=Kitasatospora sp. NPDC006697 TaxID=3364020 RepID=UPI003699B2D6
MLLHALTPALLALATTVIGYIAVLAGLGLAAAAARPPRGRRCRYLLLALLPIPARRRPDEGELTW